MDNNDKFRIMGTYEKELRRKNKIKNKRLKKLKYRLVVGGVLATTIIGGFVIKNKITENEQKNIQTIVNYYGEDSEEKKIIEYLELSETLNKLNLNSYSFDESLFSEYNILQELKNPKEIKEMINKQKEINMFISKKDILKQHENIELILNLIIQERLINNYIYTTGYSVVNQDVEDETKRYTGEVFGIKDYNNITFDYNLDSNAEQSVKIYYDSDKGKNEYSFDNFFMLKEEKNIMDGIASINNTDSYNDNDIEDNNEYNKNRNMYIKEALEKSSNLGYMTDENDLYNEELSRKMK